MMLLMSRLMIILPLRFHCAVWFSFTENYFCSSSGSRMPGFMSMIAFSDAFLVVRK